jgi:hypothetical protein
VNDGNRPTLYGYGCDDNDNDRPPEDEHFGQKQQVTLTAISETAFRTLGNFTELSARTNHKINVIHDSADGKQSCDGDSGGPAFMPSGIAGVLSAKSLGGHPFTYVARTGAVAEWIKKPEKVDVIAAGTTVTLLNLNSVICMDVRGGTAANASDVVQRLCDGKRGTTDTQSWKLRAIPGVASFFQLQNGNTPSKCLDLTGTQLVVRTCANPTTANHTQAWRFMKKNGSTRWSLVNGAGFVAADTATHKCPGLSLGSKLTEKEVKLFACSTTASQRWISVPVLVP